MRRAIRHARYAAAVVLLPVDLSQLNSRELLRLIKHWRASRRRVIARNVAAARAAPEAGIPVILPRWLFAKAAALRGDVGLRTLINSLSPFERRLIELKSAAQDVDTVDDLQRARRQRTAQLPALRTAGC